MSLPPFPQQDRIVGAEGRTPEAWWKWFNALRATVNTLITDVLDTIARVATLETNAAAQAVIVAALSQPGGSIVFASTDFTGSGGMTWAVAPADVIKDRYGRIGDWAILSFEYYNATVGGALSNTLNRRLPAALSAAADQIGQFGYVNAGTPGVGVWTLAAGDTDIQFYKDYNGTPWTAGSVSIFGQLVIEVTG